MLRGYSKFKVFLWTKTLVLDFFELSPSTSKKSDRSGLVQWKVATRMHNSSLLVMLSTMRNRQKIVFRPQVSRRAWLPRSRRGHGIVCGRRSRGQLQPASIMACMCMCMCVHVAYTVPACMMLHVHVAADLQAHVRVESVRVDPVITRHKHTTHRPVCVSPQGKVTFRLHFNVMVYTIVFEVNIWEVVS